MIAPTSFFADYGCHVRILEEARVLQRMGHVVTVVTYHNGRLIADIRIERTLPIPWRRDYEVGSSRHKVAFDALLALKTLQVLMREKYDIIHAHLHEGALIGLVLGKLFRIPVVFDFQGSLTEEMIDHQFLRRESISYAYLRRLETWIDRSSSMIFTSSTHAEELLLQHFGCEAEQITALPDCVNTDVFRPPQDFDASAQTALRRRLGVPDQKRLIVYLGLLAEYQGTGLLLEALQRILFRRSDVYLLLMGFPGIDVYQQKARDLGIEKFVSFTGRVFYEDAPSYLALGDVAVAPKLSLTESAGKLLNYMATALPTVAFDTPVAREYLGDDGLFARRGDVADLADKLSQALFNDSSATASGLRLRQRAIRLFEWETNGQRIVDVYRNLLGHNGRQVAAENWVATAK
ncbi:MAG: glycosyltransferase family 4 protein [Caldilineaceae bacterium]|nr:glycosyltransferase family 4 protein [Caldilineaceae bacterium]